MPAELSGLQNFGGGSIAVNNAIGNTPFLGGPGTGSAMGTGVGSLGNFGGYFPTPLPQFNNYPDYLTAMGKPAQQMDAYADIPVQYDSYNFGPIAGPGGVIDQQFHAATSQDLMAGAQHAAKQAIGGYWDPATGKFYGN